MSISSRAGRTWSKCVAADRTPVADLYRDRAINVQLRVMPAHEDARGERLARVAHL